MVRPAPSHRDHLAWEIRYLKKFDNREGSMFSKLHDRLGTAGLVVAVVALIAALAGTAFAAAGLNSTQKKEVKKIAKKFAGKQGPAGPAGPVGPAGPAGAAGKDGTNGTNGTNGKDGAGVEASEVPAGEEECDEQGGAKFEVAGSPDTFACNGSAADYPSSLPSGRSESGVWSFGGEADAFVEVPISFPIRLGFEPTIKWLKPGTTFGSDAQCPGNFQEPLAEAGFLCIYAATMQSSGSGDAKEPSTFYKLNSPKGFSDGVIMEILTGAGEEHYGWGTWGATAP